MNKIFVTIVADILSILKAFSMNMLFPKEAIKEHENQGKKLRIELDRYVADKLQEVPIGSVGN